MTLDEAIKRLQESVAEIGADELDDLTEAEKLGIEALKEVQYHRQYPKLWTPELLQGETEE